MFKNKNIVIFYITTAILSLVLVMGAFMEITKAPDAVASFVHLGYPIYLLDFLAIMKIGGVLALWGVFPKIVQEWAYAGIAFDFLGATYSHYMSGDMIDKIAVPAVLLVLLLISRIYKEKANK